MACLRRETVESSVGTLLCYEEGCKFLRITHPSGAVFDGETPETDCVLQLRLRAGDAEGVGGIVVDGLFVPEHGLYAKRGGIKFGVHRAAGAENQLEDYRERVERTQARTSSED